MNFLEISCILFYYRKIEYFIKDIKRLKKSRNLNTYSETEKSYYQIGVTINDILMLISSLLSKTTPELLIQVILKDLELNYETNEVDEELKNESDLLPDKLYDKQFDILVPEYLSAEKINQLENQIHKLCN